MRAGAWAKGGAARLAKAWGLSVNSVRDRASEAGRILRMADAGAFSAGGELDPNATREAALAVLGRVLASAERDGEYNAAVRAIDLWMRARRMLDREPQDPLTPPGPTRSAGEVLAWVETKLPELREAAASEASLVPSLPAAEPPRERHDD